MKKITASFLAFILTLFLAVFTAIASENEYYIICNPNSCNCVRLSPKRSGQEIGRLEFGDKVYADSKTRNGFIHCIGIPNEWGEGWVWKGYLIADQPTEYRSMATVVSNGRVLCRRYVNGSTKGSLKNGAEIMVYAYSDEWAVTNKGFIKIEYLELWNEEV